MFPLAFTLGCCLLAAVSAANEIIFPGYGRNPQIDAIIRNTYVNQNLYQPSPVLRPLLPAPLPAPVFPAPGPFPFFLPAPPPPPTPFPFPFIIPQSPIVNVQPPPPPQIVQSPAPQLLPFPFPLPYPLPQQAPPPPVITQYSAPPRDFHLITDNGQINGNSGSYSHNFLEAPADKLFLLAKMINSLNVNGYPPIQRVPPPPPPSPTWYPHYYPPPPPPPPPPTPPPQDHGGLINLDADLNVLDGLTGTGGGLLDANVKAHILR